MQSILRRHLMALMLGATAVSFATPMLFDAPAFAKNGSDDGADHDSGDDNGGSSGSGSSGDSSSDDSSSGSGSSDDGSDDGNSGSSDDDSSDDSDDDDDDDDDDSDDDSDDDNSASNSSKKAGKAAKQSGKDTARPTATITLTEASLASVQAGTHVVVDQLGRQLEVRVLNVNGQKVISAKPHGGDAKRRPGPIADIQVVPVTSVAGNDDGTPDQGQGDN